ncbi:hypothetical protein E2C01_047454 [Portunus trituberculatus]|uniref:Uncharacterized protein n=1 Tax=Portunus trituberculatus TaxID=210409 RepID=A0A5B7G7H9_PORTR|nr:hypothetical protein [Portunus trituberculatus]
MDITNQDTGKLGVNHVAQAAVGEVSIRNNNADTPRVPKDAKGPESINYTCSRRSRNMVSREVNSYGEGLKGRTLFEGLRILGTPGSYVA